jgi:excisionase family DNA binding protein
MRKFDVKIEESYRIDGRADGFGQDMFWGGLFAISGLVGIGGAAAPEQENPGGAVGAGLLTLGIGAAFLGYGAHVNSKATDGRTEHAYRTERQWRDSDKCLKRNTVIARTNSKGQDNDGRHARKASATDDASSAPNHEQKTVSVNDATPCYSGTKCLSDDNCLHGETCDSTTNECTNLTCLQPVVQLQAVSIADSLRSTAEVLATKPRVSKPSASKTDGQARTNQSKGAHTISVAEAASTCGVSENIVRNWIADGKLRAVKLGDSYRISRSELSRTWRELGGGALFAN